MPSRRIVPSATVGTVFMSASIVLLLVTVPRRQEIWRGAVVIDAGKSLVIVPNRPLLQPGPTTEVCLGLFQPGAAAEHDSIILPHRPSVDVRVLLRRPDGRVDSLYRDRNNWHISVIDGKRDSVPWGPERPSITDFGDGTFCIWAHDDDNWPGGNTRTITSVELRANHPLDVRSVEWWSGKRIPSF